MKRGLLLSASDKEPASGLVETPDNSVTYKYPRPRTATIPWLDASPSRTARWKPVLLSIEDST